MPGIIIKLGDVRKNPLLPVGTRVSYGDMANPRQEAVVVSEEVGKYRYGQRCIFVEDYHESDVNKADIEGPGGWRLEQGMATKEEIEDLKLKAEEAKNRRFEERKSKEEQRKQFREKGKALIEAKKPDWAKAVIMAIHEVDESDPMTDYFGSRHDRSILLAWSRHTRDLFPEMRKAALNCDVPEVRSLADAPKEAEHREKWSMGGGYYLKDGFRYNTGWKINKRGLSWGMDEIYETAGKDGGYQIPDTGIVKKESSVSGSGTKIESPAIGEYKGHAIITIPMNGKGFSFGMTKAKAILEHVEDIRRFVETS
ncbi:MAG: hypothetical protein JW882_14905 [Deltaproteobacteria bacterium]|nr:hypothetical protein [Deltaproteobacteria bacterium]